MKNRINFLIKNKLPKLLGVLGLIAVISFACKDDKFDDPVDERFLINTIDLQVTDALPLLKGKDSTLVFTISPASPTNAKLLWTSADPKIASVSQNGTITAHALGKVRITVTPEIGFGATATTEVEVIDRIEYITSITFENPNPEVFEGDILKLGVEVLPANHTYFTLKWKSENEDIATVTQNGTVSGLKPGVAKITVSALDGSGVKQSVNVKVNEIIDVQTVSITTTYMEPLGLGETIKLEYVVTPANASTHTLIWESDNKNVATVDGNGLVTAIAPGEARISVTAPKSGSSDGINISVAAGKINDVFTGTSTPWVANTEGATTQLKDGKLLVTTTNKGGKYRGDIKRNGGISLHAGNYRYLAVKFTRPTVSNLFLDTNQGAYLNVSNKMHLLNTAANGVPVYWADLQATFGASNKFSLTEITQLSLFQFKVADIPITEPQTYEVYWIKTFKTEQEMKDFVTNE